MKRTTLFKIHFGARLLMASIMLLFGQWIAFGLCMLLPIVPWTTGNFGFTTEDEEQLNKLFEKAGTKHKEALKTEIEAATKGLITTDQLAQKFEAMGLKDNAIKELTEAVEKQGEALRKMIEGKGNPGAFKSYEEVINEKSTEIAKLASSNNGLVKMTVDKATVTRGSVTQTGMGMVIPGVGQIAHLNPTISSLFRHSGVSPNSNGIIRYFDQQAITRAAAARAENTAFPESSITWVEQTLALQKIADSIPVTKESFNDIEFIRGEVDRLLNVNLSLKVDSDLWRGDGVAPNIKGITEYAPDLVVPPTLVDSIAEANVYDLMAVCRVVIMNNRQSKFDPKTVAMNPVDTLKFKLKKASDGHYILPPFISADGTLVDGMRVIESSQVDEDTMLVGDFRFGTIYDLQGVEIEMGWINDQFIKDAWTIKASQRLALLVRNVDVNGFVLVPSITAALASLDPAVV